MIEINLLPVEHRPKAPPRFVLPRIEVRKTFVWFAAAVFGGQILVSLWAGYEAADLAMTRSRQVRLEAECAPVAAKKSEIAALEERLKKIRSFSQRKYNWSTLLNALSDSTTRGVWLTGLSVTEVKAEDSKASGGKHPAATATSWVLKLDGSVVGQGEETAFTGKFIRELKANPVFSGLFSKIDLSNLVQKKIRDFDVYDFSIFCTFKTEKGASR